MMKGYLILFISALMTCMSYAQTDCPPEESGIDFLQTHRTTESWNGENWQMTSRDTSVYNELNLKSENIFQMYDSTSYAWLNQTKSKSFYTPFGELAESRVESWNSTDQIWADVSEEVCTYGTDSLLSGKVRQLYIGDSWVYQSQNIEYEYDEQGQELSHVIQQYINDNWTNSLKYVYSNYNDAGFYQAFDTYTWQDSVWTPQRKDTRLFNADGQITERNIYNWDGQNLDQTVQYIYFYADGTINYRIFNQIDNGNVAAANRQTYTVDDCGNIKEIVQEIYDFETSSYVNEFRYAYYYQTSEEWNTTFLEGALMGEFEIYPNPTSETFQLSFDQELDKERVLQVFNGLGQLVYQGINENQVSVKGWKSGLYYVLIQSDNQRWMQKLQVR